MLQTQIRELPGKDMHLAKGNKPLPPFIPKNHGHAMEALAQRKAPNSSKLRVIP